MCNPACCGGATGSAISTAVILGGAGLIVFAYAGTILMWLALLIICAVAIVVTAAGISLLLRRYMVISYRQPRKMALFAPNQRVIEGKVVHSITGGVNGNPRHILQGGEITSSLPRSIQREFVPVRDRVH